MKAKFVQALQSHPILDGFRSHMLRQYREVSFHICDGEKDPAGCRVGKDILTSFLVLLRHHLNPAAPASNQATMLGEEQGEGQPKPHPSPNTRAGIPADTLSLSHIVLVLWTLLTAWPPAQRPCSVVEHTQAERLWSSLHCYFSSLPPTQSTGSGPRDVPMSLPSFPTGLTTFYSSNLNPTPPPPGRLP